MEERKYVKVREPDNPAKRKLANRIYDKGISI